MVKALDIVAVWDYRLQRWRRATVVATNVRSDQPIATVVVEGRNPWTAVVPLTARWIREMRVVSDPQAITVAA